MRLSFLAAGSFCLALGLGFAPGCGSSDDGNGTGGTSGTGGAGGRGGTGGSTGGTGGSTGGTGGSTGGSGGSTGGTGGSTGGTGGSTGGTGGTAGGVTFADVQAIFAKTSSSCPLCHSGSGTALPGVFNIKNHTALLADSLECTGAMARKRVKPGDAANSYIIHKLKGEMLCPKVDGSGISAKMPAIGGSGLSADDIAKVEAWINGGAPM